MEWSSVETVRRFGRVADRDRVLTLQTFTEQNRHGDFAAGRLNPDGRDHYTEERMPKILCGHVVSHRTRIFMYVKST